MFAVLVYQQLCRPIEMSVAQFLAPAYRITSLAERTLSLNRPGPLLRGHCALVIPLLITAVIPTESLPTDSDVVHSSVWSLTAARDDRLTFKKSSQFLALTKSPNAGGATFISDAAKACRVCLLHGG